MARRARPSVTRDNGTGEKVPVGSAEASIPPPGTTGRYLVLFEKDAGAEAGKRLHSIAGLSVRSTSDKSASGIAETLDSAEAFMFPDLGVAVVNTPPDQIQALGAAENSGIMTIEPERVVYAIAETGAIAPDMPAIFAAAGAGQSDYLRGYRDAVDHLYGQLCGTSDTGAATLAAAVSEAEFTWGLQAAKVPASRYTGKGVRLAVLDTGLDLGHPDLTGRSIVSHSFVAGQQVQDGHGHGTHCIGTACGAKRPGTLPRYGIAYDAEIYAGKILSDRGSGGDAGILAGIQWAITNRCAVVSMSLGAPVGLGQSYSQVFEHVARRALAAGLLIIAAAGNESRRPDLISPVGHPANCPSIMAVGAVDQAMRIAYFSCGGLNPQGGQVDIAGPGVNIRSSWPRPQLYNTISGTSMATPHVAGIAALYAEVDPSFRGRTLMSILTQYARRMTLSARDIGAGLVQAP